HFYRLLQRAKSVNLLYVMPSDTYGSGEKSRFILQLQHELAPRNPNIHFRDLTAVVEHRYDKKYSGDIIIEKDAEMQQKLRAELERGLYPSHLNAYVNCSLQYYFNRIAKIQETDEVEEQLGADQFGNIVHKVLEDFFQPFVENEQPVQEQDLKQMLEQLPKKVETEFKRGVLESLPQQGMNYVLQQVAVKVLEKYLNLQLKWNEQPLHILRLEQTLAVTLPVETDFGTFSVKIAGKADRIDMVGNTIRVIDYKTGLVKEDNLRIKPEEMEQTFLVDRGYDKVRQLWLYRYILARLMQEGLPFISENLLKQVQNPELQAGILSFRTLDRGILTSQLQFPDDTDGSVASYIAESEKYLRRFVQHMLDPQEPIRKTHDLEVCQYCPYRGICAR
ncbi:MAG: PD-(D/E)XK nuclease family protein, partial [Hymenobacteraceae bacterium]|nr:PD-(D/E)XK nuclease family protein [Hymenobacteraceae bacterium]MDX5397769.1 PD-(D/E)XK nuclease family protein [Hymenobacteraceae bacterium]MDX5513846.1 PD-(D/E)XK nuclease family protein [Hymenobacteraceae bacterium]